MQVDQFLVLRFADQAAEATHPLLNYLDVGVLPGDTPPVWTPGYTEPVLSLPAHGAPGWGDTLNDYRPLAAIQDGMPAHVRVDLIVDPDGILVRGLCRCGWRAEVLCREEVINRNKPDSERIAMLMQSAAAVASALRTEWIEHHQGCGTAVTRSIPLHLNQVMARHCLRAGAVLVAACDVPSYMGILVSDPSGAAFTVLTTLDGMPSVGSAGRQACPAGRLGTRDATRLEWLASRQSRMRDVLHESNLTPLAAVFVHLSLRHARLAQDPLPSRATMLKDPRTEWSVTVTGVTQDDGRVLKTPWRTRATGTVGVMDPNTTPLAVPCDVLDGVLARELWPLDRR